MLKASFTCATFLGLFAMAPIAKAEHLRIYQQAANLDCRIVDLQKELSFFPRTQTYYHAKRELVGMRRSVAIVKRTAHHGGDVHYLKKVIHQAERHFHAAKSYVQALYQFGHHADHHSVHRGGYPDPHRVKYALQSVETTLHRLHEAVHHVGHGSGGGDPGGYGPGGNGPGGYANGGYDNGGYDSPPSYDSGRYIPGGRYNGPGRYGNRRFDRYNGIGPRSTPRITFGNGRLRLRLGG